MNQDNLLAFQSIKLKITSFKSNKKMMKKINCKQEIWGAK